MTPAALLLQAWSRTPSLSRRELKAIANLDDAALDAEVASFRQCGAQLEDDGDSIHLTSWPSRLVADEILARIPSPEAGGWRVTVFEETASTNDLADRMGRDGEAAPHALFAESQTKGRGRQGRSWIAPRGASIQLSALLRPQWPPSDASRLTALGALAGARAVRGLTGLPVAVKWPNDLFLAGRKLAGVLTEIAVREGRLAHAVVGIGLNVSQRPEDFPEEIRQTATSLAQHMATPPRRNILAASILHEISTLLETDREALMEEWRGLCFHLGHQITIRREGGDLVGTATDIDPSGYLVLCEATGQIHHLNTGEIVRWT